MYDIAFTRSTLRAVSRDVDVPITKFSHILRTLQVRMCHKLQATDAKPRLETGCQQGSASWLMTTLPNFCGNLCFKTSTEMDSNDP